MRRPRCAGTGRRCRHRRRRRRATAHGRGRRRAALREPADARCAPAPQGWRRNRPARRTATPRASFHRAGGWMARRRCPAAACGRAKPAPARARQCSAHPPRRPARRPRPRSRAPARRSPSPPPRPAVETSLRERPPPPLRRSRTTAPARAAGRRASPAGGARCQVAASSSCPTRPPWMRHLATTTRWAFACRIRRRRIPTNLRRQLRPARCHPPHALLRYTARLSVRCAPRTGIKEPR